MTGTVGLEGKGAEGGRSTDAPGARDGSKEALLVPRRRVRVLFINDTSRNGGPGRSLFSILKFLDPAVVHRTVVLPRDGVISELLLEGGVADHLFYEKDFVENPFEPAHRAMERGDFDAPWPLKAGRLAVNVGRATRGFVSLASAIRRGAFDLLYCNGTNADFAGGLLSAMTGVPALWHARYTSVPALTVPTHRRLAASPGVRRIVCVSQAVANLFDHCADKVRVIHNAVDLESFDPAAIQPTLRKEMGWSPETVVFGSQGRILPRKGYVEMIQAARLAVDKLSSEEKARVRFAVVGDTPADIHPDHLVECRRLVDELGLRDVFCFTGFRADVKPCVADFDVTVVPSTYADPLPRAVIEGMALGKPVVAFNVGGVGEMLADGQTGTLVSGTPADIPAMADAFLRYIRDPALRIAQGRLGRRRIEEHFDGRSHGRQIQNQIVSASGL